MSNATDRWEFYRDAREKWRWRRVAANGRIVDASTQGYGTRSTCITNATRCGYKEPIEREPQNDRLSLMGHFQPRHNVHPADQEDNEHEKSSP